MTGLLAPAFVTFQPSLDTTTKSLSKVQTCSCSPLQSIQVCTAEELGAHTLEASEWHLTYLHHFPAGQPWAHDFLISKQPVVKCT